MNNVFYLFSSFPGQVPDLAAIFILHSRCKGHLPIKVSSLKKEIPQKFPRRQSQAIAENGSHSWRWCSFRGAPGGNENSPVLTGRRRCRGESRKENLKTEFQTRLQPTSLTTKKALRRHNQPLSGLETVSLHRVCATISSTLATTSGSLSACSLYSQQARH